MAEVLAVATPEVPGMGAGNAGLPSGRDLESLLGSAGLLTREAAARAKVAARESNESFELVVTRLGLVSEETLVAAIARETGLPVLPAADFPPVPVPVKLQSEGEGEALSVPFLRDNHVLPVRLEAHAVTIAVVDPFDSFVIRSLAFVFGLPVRCVLARASDIESAIERLYGAAAHAEGAAEDIYDEEDLDRLKDLVSDAPIIRAVNRLIAQASDARASDIHVEPTEDALTVRFRIDGALQERDPLPAAMKSPLVSRIKIMAGLNIAERRLPQDGRMRIAVRGQDIDLRVATVPAIHGESVVMRILDRSQLALDFPSLGFDAKMTEDLRAAAFRPHGIVLVTGPTGSGKTTTLYAALSELNQPERKVLTVEDPIEYRLPGVIQTQVNPQIGLTFDAALRSFLRLDPDVIMVGEIRDTETAQIAVQAALTGHLILSTLHTNSAAGAITRLADMGVEPFLLSSVLNGVLAQRLVRRLCRECAEPCVAPAELLARLGLESHETVTFHRALGCEACQHTGYAGRIAVLEFLRVDDAIARLILRGAGTREIAEASAAAGDRSLLMDGIAKARAGLIAIEDALRVGSGE